MRVPISSSGSSCTVCFGSIHIMCISCETQGFEVVCLVLHSCNMHIRSYCQDFKQFFLVTQGTFRTGGSFGESRCTGAKRKVSPIPPSVLWLEPSPLSPLLSRPPLPDLNLDQHSNTHPSNNLLPHGKPRSTRCLSTRNTHNHVCQRLRRGVRCIRECERFALREF